MRCLPCVLVALLGWPPAIGARDPREPNEELVHQVDEIKRDVATLNLLNGLNLNRDQVERTLALARQARDIRRERSRALREALEEAKTAFSNLRAEVRQGEPPQGAVAERAQRAKKHLQDLRTRVLQNKASRLRALDDRLQEVLTGGQLHIVAEFRPCLIPPFDLNSQTSVGQADVHPRVVEHLRKLREVPARVWERRRDRMVRRITGRITSRVRLTDEELAAEQRRILDLLERVRGLSDLDFEMEKIRIARQLKPRDRIGELHEELLWRLPGSSPRKLSKPARFLLDERVIPLLEERLRVARMAGR